ncbi:vWA domain-containing protein [Streptacidiphilus rugosus]|uniref:vWA domain-containing protein n=1 Tax=Streptacidiphilus rugosus TaxID=405783 RepID=UPI0005645508|nr:TROVE domain-containing protein [Streptacidiphilus rugosus]
MSRFNTKAARPAGSSPVTTTGERATTHQGGEGHLRDPRSELFLLAVTNMVGQDTFYESGGRRDDRFTQLVRKLAVEDPAWTSGLLSWLRGDADMRTAALVGAAEFTRARLDAGLDGRSRQAVDSVLQRPDEPGELIAYWTGRYGRNLPKPVKRGVADAVARLYTERGLLKYDTDSKGYRFGDVLELVHAAPAKPYQHDLFKHAIDRRHNREDTIPASLGTIRRRAELFALPVAERRAVLTAEGGAERLAEAGVTWEALAGWLQGPMDTAAWEAVIPSMGYMALLRNLRNFDEADVSDEVARAVAARLADPAEVARSRQLPMRFYSAFRAAPSLRWGWALEQALGHSLANVPALRGRTLILVDTSGSMHAGFSKDGTVMRWDAAVVFGLALGHRCANADVVSFSDSGYTWAGRQPATAPDRVFPLAKGGSVLAEVRRWSEEGYFIGGGTDTAGAIRRHYRGHDRVVILTDEQANGHASVDQAVPGNVPLYTWNLAGYRVGHAPSGSAHRHAFGGLTDQGFRMIPLLESGADTAWPWESRG